MPRDSQLIALSNANHVSLEIAARFDVLTPRFPCDSGPPIPLGPEVNSLSLPTPLGVRALVQTLGGGVIHYVGGDNLAVVPLLPKGCHLGQPIPTNGNISGQFPPELLSTGAIRTCVGRNSGAKSPYLSVGQWVGVETTIGLTVEGHASVHGHRAVFTGTGYFPHGQESERAISFSEHGYTFAILSVPEGPNRNLRTLSYERLLAVAISLEVPTEPT
jgi:hypothetical protein